MASRNVKSLLQCVPVTQYVKTVSGHLRGCAGRPDGASQWVGNAKSVPASLN
jgi:hypothetical protein